MKAVLWCGCFAVSLALDPRDLQRALTKVPRAQWKGNTFDSMSHTLNGHMNKMFPKTKPCSEWSAEELQTYQSLLFKYKHEELSKVYTDSSDNRRMIHDSLEEHQQQWSNANSNVALLPHMREMQRDGHCHEAVMWLVHHVPVTEQQTVFAQIPAPLLSTTRHSCKASATANEADLCRTYQKQLTCSECHSGTGMLFQNWTDIPGIIPEDPKYPGRARQRRCDQNYLPKCGPCDGVGGPYWGDELSAFQPTNCELVTKPEDVPIADRQSPQFGEQFIVHQLGSDRLIRTQNAAKYALYSQIRSTLWYDFPVGGESNGTTKDGMAHLRHDTYYDDLLYKWMDNGLVSEIHTQTRAQREANITGPMMSILHGLYGYGKYMGGLTCLAAPVGVPVLGGIVDTRGVPHSAFLEGADYLGRVKIGVEYDGFKLGDKGHGDMKAKRNMTVDHYIKWFLHVFVDADKQSPTFGQIVRFYGPYSGFAVYVKVEKKAPPAAVWEQICPDNGWGQPEHKPLHPCKGKTILDTKEQVMVIGDGSEVCSPFTNGTSANLQGLSGEVLKGSFGTIVMPKESAMAAGKSDGTCGYECTDDSQCTGCGSAGKCSCPDGAGNATRFPQISCSCVSMPANPPTSPPSDVALAKWPEKWTANVDAWCYGDMTHKTAVARGKFYYDATLGKTRADWTPYINGHNAGQVWITGGGKSRYYVKAGPLCIYFPITDPGQPGKPNVGIEKADWMQACKDAGLGRYIGREQVNVQGEDVWADHWSCHMDYEAAKQQITFQNWHSLGLGKVPAGLPVRVTGGNSAPNGQKGSPRLNSVWYKDFDTSANATKPEDFDKPPALFCIPVGAEEVTAFFGHEVSPAHAFNPAFHRRAHYLLHAKASVRDLARARRPTPGRAFQGNSFATTMRKLNGMLLRETGLKTQKCADFSLQLLHEMQRELFNARTHELDAIYSSAGDTRRMVHNSTASLEMEQTNVADIMTPGLLNKARDGACHEMVMWYTHHLSETARKEISERLILPLLPEMQHEAPTKEDSSEAAQLHQRYTEQVSCAVCHVTPTSKEEAVFI